MPDCVCVTGYSYQHCATWDAEDAVSQDSDGRH